MEGNTKSSNLLKFMLEFTNSTAPVQQADHLRLWQRNVQFEVSSFNGAIQLSFIKSFAPGKGHASQALDWLLRLADTHGVEIRGAIRRVGRDGLSERALKLWYKRHGFLVEHNKISYNARAA
jgi:hypothetical protein